jgi:SPP1 family phage portal protein
MRPRTALDGLNGAVIAGVLKEFMAGADRRKRLHDYYVGDQAIRRRKRHSKWSANNKIVVNRAGYIVRIASAYLIGKPVSYASERQADALQRITEAYRRATTESVDMELAKAASEQGRGVEIVYASEASEPRVAAIDPRLAFVVYDNSVAHDPLFGVQINDEQNDVGDITGVIAIVYTGAEIRSYRLPTRGGIASMQKSDWDRAHLIEIEVALGADGTPLPQEHQPLYAPQTHLFGGVPMIEYWNNAEERGDFEPVIDLLDAYNLLTSDRVNDKEQLVNALLVIVGAKLGNSDGEAAETLQKIMEERVLELPGGAPGVDAKYLIKQLTESDVQVLCESIKEDIHSISMVPNLSDENFAGVASGVALRYKLIAFEQFTKEKERWFREGLETRLKLFARYLAAQKKIPAGLAVEDVEITFTRGLPANDLEQAQVVQTLQGIVPDEILLQSLDIVKDPGVAMEMLRKQKQEAAKEEAARYGPPYPDANGPGGEA